MTKKKPKKNVGMSEPTGKKRVSRGRKPTPKPAPKAPKKKSGPRISAETYNKLQSAYYEKQSINHAAKAAGVCFKTAKTYIEGPGRPDLGLVPIKQLWLDVQVEAQERKQITLVRFQEAQVKELEEIIGTTLAELKLIRAEVSRRVKRFQESGGKEIETGASMNSALKNYERSVKLMERLLGAPDMTVRTETEDEFRDWSDDEIIAYMTTGIMPEHAR